MAVFTKNRLAHAISASLPFVLGLSLTGCGDDNLNPDDIGAPDTYNFSSQTSRSGESSVDYRDAITRLVLIKELEYLIGSKFLQDYATGKTKEEVVTLLNRVYTHGTASLATNNIYDLHDPEGIEVAGPTPINGLTLMSGLNLQQTHFNELSPNINLSSVMPGKAYDLHYVDGNEKIAFLGWSISGVTDENDMPEAMIQQWFGVIADLAIDGDSSTRVVHTNSGRDYQKLISTFLLGAIAYGQSVNLHLNKGLDSENSDTASDLSYTPLQHHWDMAYGYYGAARQLSQLTKSQTANQPDHNYEGSDIDIFSEYTFDYPRDAAKRDIGTVLYNTNFYGNPMQAFLNGRQIIDSYFPDNTTNNSEFLVDLDIQKNMIIDQWEKTIAATAIHYINETAESVLYYGQVAILNAEYFKDWSRAKGYLLALQFNPDTKIGYADYQELHNLLGAGPELDPNPRDLYKYAGKMNSTHTIFQSNYGFSTSNIQEW
jgi:hypothetical protein